MKSLKKIALTSLALSALATAGDDIAKKITSFYNVASNGAIVIEAKKSGDGYDIKFSPKNSVYQKIFNQNGALHISVDKGFFSTTLESKGELFSIFSKELQNDIKKDIKVSPKYEYRGKIGFSGTLEEKFRLEPFKVENKEVSIDSSEVVINTEIDLDKQTGVLNLNYNQLLIKPKKEEGLFKISGLKLQNEITDPPVDGFVLYSKSKINIKEVEFLATKPKKEHIKFAAALDSYIKKVDSKLLDLYISATVNSNDIDTIVLAKGVKEVKNSWLFKNLGSEGFIEFLKLSKKMEEAQNKLAQASQSQNNNEALAKYMATMDEINNKLVPIFNKMFLKDKTKLILNLELNSDKTNYLKADLTYKAAPIKGNMNSAFISLAAQGLAIVDGDIEVKIDRNLANTINPFSIMVLDMLKNKNMAHEKNGVYEFKATLKGGNIIVNGKSYTLQEFSKALF